MRDGLVQNIPENGDTNMKKEENHLVSFFYSKLLLSMMYSISQNKFRLNKSITMCFSKEHVWPHKRAQIQTQKRTIANTHSTCE